MPRKRIPHEVNTDIIEENAQSLEMAIFAKTLNTLLVEKGVHQDDMAQALGISTGSISSWRNGKKEPRLSMIVKIANYLGVDCHYLITGIQSENYICSKELGLSERAIVHLKEIEAYSRENPAGLVPNPINALLSSEGPAFNLWSGEIQVSAFKVFWVELASYIHERMTEPKMESVQELNEQQHDDLFALSESLAEYGYTIMAKHDAAEIHLQNACDALKALFRVEGGSK